jgi:HSP20 family protein
MTRVHYEPISLFGRFNDEINRLLTGSMAQDTAAQTDNWTPAVDIREEDDRFVLFADIPGVARETLDISLEDGVLTVKGERRTSSGDRNNGFRHRERASGTFLRRFSLPDTVSTETITAAVSDGVLQIEIPKQQKAQARRITVG